MNVITACKILDLMLLLFAGGMGFVSAKNGLFCHRVTSHLTSLQPFPLAALKILYFNPQNAQEFILGVQEFILGVQNKWELSPEVLLS